MHSTKKGGQWYFGMKVHAGVDAGSGHVHTITGTSANVHDVTQTHALIREDDEVASGDSDSLGVEKRQEIREDERLSNVDFRITRRPGSIKTLGVGRSYDRSRESRKSSTRSDTQQSRTPLSDREGILWLPQDIVSRHSEEHEQSPCSVWLCQSCHVHSRWTNGRIFRLWHDCLRLTEKRPSKINEGA